MPGFLGIGQLDIAQGGLHRIDLAVLDIFPMRFRDQADPPGQCLQCAQVLALDRFAVGLGLFVRDMAQRDQRQLSQQVQRDDQIAVGFGKGWQRRFGGDLALGHAFDQTGQVGFLQIDVGILRGPGADGGAVEDIDQHDF